MKKTKQINVGGIPIGGGARITVQSMTNTKTGDVAATVAQIKALEVAGCDIIRVAVPDMEAAQAIKEIKKQIRIPIVADIHFDYRLALESIKNGADKIRLNPGNIGGADRVAAVASAAKERNVPIRIGVNGGSLDKELLAKYKSPTAEAIVESAGKHIKMLEDCDFGDIAVSLKTSDVSKTIEAYKLFSSKYDYPLHVGITESGSRFKGTVKSSVGIGSILAMGIGDTIRVSLTGSPIEEVKVGREILKSLGLAEKGVEIISCPTCGRTRVNLAEIADEIAEKTADINKNITVAVMGCAVNGPGEAREADLGVACGKGEGLLFKKGEIIGKVKENEIVSKLMEMIHNYNG